MKTPNFADLYCAEHGIQVDRFSVHLLRRALYPHARLVRPALVFLCPDYFAADNDFVCNVAQLTRYHEFYDSSIDFVHHPSNRGILRQWFRVRISTDRMRRLVRHTFRQHPASDDNQGTMSPLGGPPKPKAAGDSDGLPAPLRG